MSKLFNRLFRYLLYFILAGVLISLLIVLPFRWVNPPITMVQIDRWWQGDADFVLQKHWLDWDELPKNAALAVIAAEDQRFPLHQGFDWDSIKKALSEREQRGQLRGASTISQQVAKNIYLWTGRSWFRKGLEVWLTFLIELTWGKQRILEVYLNIAEWGPGVFGLEAASRHHFNRSAIELTQMQTALLASSLPSPLRFDPARPSDYLRKRAQWNIEQQRRLGGVNWLAPIM